MTTYTTPATVELARLDLGRALRDVDDDHVSVLTEVLDSCPPILVGLPRFVLLDGHMRVAAARRLGRLELPAVFTGGSAAEQLEAQVRENSSHGLPLTRAERGRAVDRLIEAAPDWSNYRIAAAAGVHEKTVRNHRRGLEGSTPEVPIRPAVPKPQKAPPRDRRSRFIRLIRWLWRLFR